MNNWNRIVKKNQILINAYIIQLILIYIKNMLVQGVPFLLAINGYLNILLFGILGVVYVMAFLKTSILLTITREDVVVISIVIFQYSLSAIQAFGDNNINLVCEHGIRFVSFSFLSYFIFKNIDDYDLLLDKLYRVCIPLCLVGIVSSLALLWYSSRGLISEYSMPLSYYMLLPMTVLASKQFYRRINLIEILIIIISVLMIFACGSRGPLLCLFSFLTVEYLKSISKKPYRVLIGVIIVLFLMFFILNIEAVIGLCADVIGDKIYNYRTIKLLLSGEITYDSGRAEIYDCADELLKNNPILGVGLYGTLTKLNATSAHSMIYDFWLNYGYVCGTIFMGVISCSVLFFLNYKKNASAAKEIVLIMLMQFLPKITIGGDSWHTEGLWCVMGIVFAWKYRGYTLSNTSK